MRYGDILVDLAAIVKASRGVASRHLELRSRQWGRYGETSSVLRSLKDRGVRQGSPVKPGQIPPASEVATPSVFVSGAASEAESGSADPTSPPPPRETRQIIRPSASEQQAKLSNLARGFPQQSRIEAEDPVPSPLRQALSEARLTPAQPHNEDILAAERAHGNRQRISNDSPVDTDDDPPSDVDTNIFHTTRGSAMLDRHKDYVGKVRPAANPSMPSWFTDFGHGKDKSEAEEPIVASATTESVPSQAPEVAAPDQAGPRVADPAPEVIADGAVKREAAHRTAAEEEHARMAEDVLQRTEVGASSENNATPTPEPVPEASRPAYVLRESRVPSTRMGRLWNYGGLAAGMLGGAITESFSRGFGGGGTGSVMLSSGNMERLVSKLSRMRGAALKIGQMLSFQDSKMLPDQIREVFERVQDRADYMPTWQRDRVLTTSLGPEWRELFDEFEDKPIAAASIGQVHRATLKATGQKVAVKIQFPGVADSINSDLDNLSMLLLASGMLPKGLYLNKTIDNARTELGWECDYEREADCGQRYRELLSDEPDVFAIPEIYREACGKHVLTMEYMEGVGVTKVKSFTQEQRDWIGTQILRLCLREIVEFRFMQTDPNWTNFMYNAETNKLELLDFGASREFPEKFVRLYVSLLAAAAKSDRETVKDLSEQLGYLTGHESKTMLDAHIASILTLAEPFLGTAPEVYDFHDQTITERVKALIPVMIRERLSPPPEETYSLHRKLSGAFLLCARLGSRVRCRELFENALAKMKSLEAEGVRDV